MSRNRQVRGRCAHLRACRYCMPRAQSSAISTARRRLGCSASRRRTRLIRHTAHCLIRYSTPHHQGGLSVKPASACSRECACFACNPQAMWAPKLTDKNHFCLAVLHFMLFAHTYQRYFILFKG